ncbi:unnamed protein product [Trifolium pratense]|uniref:Uncharacterized protein n=1 Tax=Trifolium pratense TaxID=57577 RepID=A0ACB0IN42_TRIPR|nr:unnamed protein product [Trifolium pratense]
MPPRRSTRVLSREAVSNEASSQPREEAPRGRGLVQQIANRFGDQGQPQVEQNQVDSEHSQEVVQDEQHPVHPRVTEVSLTSFVKMDPPTFSGSDVHEDPQVFLDEVSWICKGLGCSSTRMVELAAFRLRDVARGWYETMLLARSVGSPPLEWDEYAQRFLAQFLPRSVRDSRAQKFENLVQLDQMTIMEYNIQFMRLSRYAPHLVATEQLRVQRFVDGLKSYLFRAIAGHGDMTYEQALNRALAIERGNRDRGGASRDTRKRSHSEASRSGRGGFFGESSRNDVGQGRRGQQGGRQPQTTQGSQTGSSTHRWGTTQHQLPFVTTPSACVTCGNAHIGPCRHGLAGCYRCGQIGHYARVCPTLSTQPSTNQSTERQPGGSGMQGHNNFQRGGRGSRGRGQSQVGGGQARVFALTRQDAQASNAVVTGMLSICSHDACVLFDPGATHSFVSRPFAACLGIDPSLLEVPLMVATPIGDYLLAKTIYRSCKVLIEGHSLLADLVELNMVDFDVILGMD